MGESYYELCLWRNEEFNNGNRIKASKIERVINEMVFRKNKYIENLRRNRIHY
jgi:hypothetical protein